MDNGRHWFVMRDLKRPNALHPAYKILSKAGFDIFTPMVTKIVQKEGRKTKVKVPFMQDLLFVCTTRADLDPVVEDIPTLQYRFVKGGGYRQPLEVPYADMARFMAFVSAVEEPQYYNLDELNPSMYGSDIRIISAGQLNGFEGKLLSVKGSRKKRLLVELSCPGLFNLGATVEITAADYVQIL